MFVDREYSKSCKAISNIDTWALLRECSRILIHETLGFSRYQHEEPYHDQMLVHEINEHLLR